MYPKYYIPTVRFSDILHLPIKRLYMSDLKKGNFPITIKEVYVDAPIYSDTFLLNNIKKLSCNVYVFIFTDKVKDSRDNRGPNILEILETKLDKVKLVSGSNREDYEDVISF